MPLETASYISQLNSANPLGSDPIAAGDDHIRLIKAALKNTFPSVTGPVTVTQDELNSIPDLASAADVATAIAAIPTSGRIRQSLYSVSAGANVYSTGWTATGHQVTITPTSTASKILVMVHGGDNWNHNRADLLNNQTKIYRNGTPTAARSNQAGTYIYGADMSRGGVTDWTNSMILLDSPATTSPVTYQVYITGEFGYGDAIMVVLEIL